MTEKAKVYRAELPGMVCPHGLAAKRLLEEHGFDVEDHALISEEAIEVFKQEYGVETTPQIFIGERRIGGADDLEHHLASCG